MVKKSSKSCQRSLRMPHKDKWVQLKGKTLLWNFFIQRCALQKEENLAEQISMHSRPLGAGGAGDAMAPQNLANQLTWDPIRYGQLVLTAMKKSSQWPQKSVSTFQILVAGGLCLGCICFYIPFSMDDWKMCCILAPFAITPSEKKAKELLSWEEASIQL